MAEDDRIMEAEEAGLPPQPPEVDRKTKLHVYQWVGLPLMALVVVAALAGAFGETRTHVSDSAETLAVEAEYPARFRYKTIEPITLWITNTTDTPMDTVTVSFDTAYMSGFSTISIVPAPAQPWQVELMDVQPAETRLVVAEIQAERYWRHEGTVEVAAAGLDTVRLELSTLTYP